MLLLDKPKKTSSEAIIDGDTAPSSLTQKVGNVALAELEKNMVGQQQSVIAGTTEAKKETTELKDIQNDSNGLEFVVEKRDIILENDINNQQYCMPSIEVKFLKGEGSLFFSDLIERLKAMNFPLNNCMLFCWDEKRGMHVFVANDPIPQPHFLPAHLCGIANSIYLKFRSYQQQSIQPTQRAMSYSQQSYNNSNNLNRQSINQFNNVSSGNNINNSIASSNNNNNNMNTSMLSNNSQIIKEEDLMLSEDNSLQGDSQSKRNKKMMLMGGNSSNSLMRGANNNMNTSDKRVKERYIEKVREKVSEWRAMHETGFRDKDGNIQKLNLDHAANYIGISRKTLDDYYLQLRRAEQLGFDFDRNKSEKMGALRKFVKEESKKQSRKSPAMQNNNNILNNSMSNNVNSAMNNSMNYSNLMNSNINNNNVNNNNVMNSSNLSSNHNTNNNMFNMNANLAHFGQMGESDEDNEQSSQDVMSHAHNPRNNLKNLTGLQYINSLQSNSNSIHNNNSMASIIKSVHSSNNNNNIGSIGGLGNMSSVCSSGSGGSVNLLSKNSIQSLIGTSVQNPLMTITQQQSSYFQPRNSATLLTPYNYNNNNQPNFNQSGGSFYGNNNHNYIMGGSNLQNSNGNNNQGNNSQVLLQAYQSRGSYMMNEGGDNSSNNLANISNNQQTQQVSSGNKPMQRNSMNGTQLFNPGSSFISNTNPSGFQNSSALHNLELNSSNQNQLPSSEIQVEQRFSNHFSLMQLGNASQIVEERNSFNFLNSGISANNNNINNPSDTTNNNNRLSNSSLFQMTEDNNYISSNNNANSNIVGSSKSAASIIANQINSS